MTPSRRRSRSPVSKPSERAQLSADRFPHLAAFLSGYLHQDFPLDHATPAAALTAFLDEANASERQALRDDWRSFRAAVTDLGWRELRDTLAGLGGAWRPASRAALLALFARFDDRP